MGIAVDLIIVAAYIFMIFLAAKRGFVLTLIDLVGSILAMAIAFMISGSIAEWLYDNHFRETVLEMLTKHLPAGLSTSSFNLNPNIILDAFPEYIQSFITRFDLIPTGEALQSITDVFNVAVVEEKIVMPMAIGFLKMVCFIPTGIIILIAIKFVARIISKLVKKTPLKGLNTVLGAALGAVKGVLVIVLVCGVLTLLASFMSESSFTTGIAQSKICGMITNLFT